jgi:hypothetical protein
MRFTYPIFLCVCLLLAACTRQPQNGAPSLQSLKIEKLDPNFTVAGKAFNLQPDGQSALSVVGSQIPTGAMVFWNDQPLKTGGGGQQGWVGAAVPPERFAAPAVVKITVRAPDGATVSNALDFTVYAQTGPPPEIMSLYPTSALAGKGFNLQPDGGSALGVTGAGFLPGAKVVFGGKEMRTAFGRGDYISVAVPAALAVRVGASEVWVTNPDGKTSNKVVFRIANQ